MNNLVPLANWAWMFGILGLAAAGGVFAYLRRQDPGSAEFNDPEQGVPKRLTAPSGGVT